MVNEPSFVEFAGFENIFDNLWPYYSKILKTWYYLRGNGTQARIQVSNKVPVLGGFYYTCQFRHP